MVTTTQNIPLDDAATGTNTGTVGEPAVAASSTRWFVTGNWFASRSNDRGATWSFVDPFTETPSVGRGFCCDQLVLYARSHQLWIWLLQFNSSPSGNVFRLAVSRTAAPGTWTWWDVAPTDVNSQWAGLWFDYPDMAETDDHVWITFNLYDQQDEWHRAVVFKYPKDDLAARGALSRQTWTSTSLGSIKLVSGATDTMWFASHGGTSRRIELQSWRDDRADIDRFPITITPWNETTYSSRGPGGAEWLSRADGRMTAGWRRDGELGFAWTASPRPGRPHPHVRVVRMDEQSLAVIDEPDLWSANGAWAYPSIAPNRRGDLGMTAFFGGPTHPAHAVGVFDEAVGAWSMTTTSTSTHGPQAGKWGDYLTIRAHPTRRSSWIASGYTLQGGTDRRNIEPRVVVFRP